MNNIDELTQAIRNIDLSDKSCESCKFFSGGKCWQDEANVVEVAPSFLCGNFERPEMGIRGKATSYERRKNSEFWAEVRHGF